MIKYTIGSTSLFMIVVAIAAVATFVFTVMSGNWPASIWATNALVWMGIARLQGFGCVNPDVMIPSNKKG